MPCTMMCRTSTLQMTLQRQFFPQVGTVWHYELAMEISPIDDMLDQTSPLFKNYGILVDSNLSSS